MAEVMPIQIFQSNMGLETKKEPQRLFNSNR